MEGIEFDSRDGDRHASSTTGNYEPFSLTGLVMKLSGNIIKKRETANNILVVITVTSFTVSGIIFSQVFSTDERAPRATPEPVSKEVILPILNELHIPQATVDRLPNEIYQEDIPLDIAQSLPPQVLDSIPHRP